MNYAEFENFIEPLCLSKRSESTLLDVARCKITTNSTAFQRIACERILRVKSYDELAFEVRGYLVRYINIDDKTVAEIISRCAEICGRKIDYNKDTEASELAEWIHNNLSERAILEQLAEEASELAAVHADMARSANDVAKYALKVIRATHDENPTTAKEGFARDSILANIYQYERLVKDMNEEYLDVGNAASVYRGNCIYYEYDIEKLRRWKMRIESAKRGD